MPYRQGHLLPPRCLQISGGAAGRRSHPACAPSPCSSDLRCAACGRAVWGMPRRQVGRAGRQRLHIMAKHLASKLMHRWDHADYKLPASSHACVSGCAQLHHVAPALCRLRFGQFLYLNAGPINRQRGRPRGRGPATSANTGSSSSRGSSGRGCMSLLQGELLPSLFSFHPPLIFQASRLPRLCTRLPADGAPPCAAGMLPAMLPGILCCQWRGVNPTGRPPVLVTTCSTGVHMFARA